MVLSRSQLALVATAALVGTALPLRAQNELVFAKPVHLALDPSSQPRDLRVLDVTGDGILDLVAVGVITPAVRVSVGTGPTTFNPQVDTLIAPVSAFDLGDMNGDGKPDLVKVPTTLPANLRTQFGDGLGGFQSAGIALDITAGGTVFALRVLDADEDGNLDAVVEQGGSLYTYLGDGTGIFIAPGIHTPSPFILIKEELQVFDSNGDGHLDLMGSGNAFFPTGWSVFLGDGRGGFSYSQHAYNSVDGDSFANALGDFDGDHRTDIVVHDDDVVCGCQKFAFAQNTGSGFVEPPRAEASAPFESRMRTGDLNRDGLDDIVGVSGPKVLLGHGDFTFAPPQSVSNELTSLGDVALSDLDGDGVLDLVAVSAGAHVSIFINQSPPSGWTDLGSGLAGSDGIPSLLGQGELQFGSSGSLKLTHANPDKLAVLFIGPSSNPTPFKGGTLVPIPVTMAFMLGTSPTGTITLAWNSWPHLPPGTDYFFQYAIVDSAGPAGASLSNAVRALQP